MTATPHPDPDGARHRAEGRPRGLVRPTGPVVECDIAVIGSGMGGATLAYALRGTGARVLVVERGDFLPREWQNWSAPAVFTAGRYRNAEPWYDAGAGRYFDPGVHYYVGGNTKVFGATLPRFREADFGPLEHADGVSRGWPFPYGVLEPHYARAERLYRVHGARGADPTDPWRSGEYPWPAVAHEPPVASLAESLRAQGLKPFALPTGVDLRPDGACLRCATCDGFPCLVEAKSDADVCALRPALAAGNVSLLTRATVTRLVTGPSGRRVTAALARYEGGELRIHAERFVLACGAVNTAALLLRSEPGALRTGPVRESGLANGSGQAGRNYMVHNSTFLMAVDPRRADEVVFQKTLGVNDWYLGNGTHGPLGNVQALGKLRAPSAGGLWPRAPRPLLAAATRRSMDLYLTSEDLPAPDNRVTVGPRERVEVHWRPVNLPPHRELVRRATAMMRRAGFPLVFTRRMGIAVNSHQCGTAVAGEDPATSVVGPDCKAHELDNLWVADSSWFPSSAAVNPALTIAANALRIAPMVAGTADAAEEMEVPYGTGTSGHRDGGTAGPCPTGGPRRDGRTAGP
ncbi:GMC oxidoreductase [Streptomyces rimosus]|uniref:GMC oxidoreductase n=1 Tax=Streptomyces rimosus TaxID=1927 RepID=UPI0004CB5BDB|nr:GMC family oxidoreductase [Streptomyces rimosus]